MIDKAKKNDLSKFGLEPIPPLTGQIVDIELVTPRPAERAKQQQPEQA